MGLVVGMVLCHDIIHQIKCVRNADKSSHSLFLSGEGSEIDKMLPKYFFKGPLRQCSNLAPNQFM